MYEYDFVGLAMPYSNSRENRIDLGIDRSMRVSF